MAKKKAQIRGEVVVRPLNAVKPNGWNPNVVPPHVMRSIEHGFRVDGWIASAALLVWGTDERGERRDLIIDGEHKWRAGKAVGLIDGPMVFLDGLTEREAKALTVKMNQKRGAWDEDRVGALLAEIRGEVSVEDFALDLGFGVEEVDAYLTEDRSSVGDAPAPPPRVSLAERFGVPPFSVLNAREGWWQARKAAWLALGIKSELGRGDMLAMGSEHVSDMLAMGSEHVSDMHFYIKKNKANAAPGGSKQPLDRPGYVERLRSVSPGGSPRPATKIVGGKIQRGDGRGRAIPAGSP